MIKLFDEIPHIVGQSVELGRVQDADADALQELVQSKTVHRYLPTFLFESQFDNMHEAIAQLYGDLYRNKESLILGIYLKGENDLCGLAEFYGLRDDVHKISVGYRLREKYWGRGIATEVVALMVDYLYTSTDIELITASTMVENHASARVLQKNGFIRTVSGVEEDWGYERLVSTDKWFG